MLRKVLGPSSPSKEGRVYSCVEVFQVSNSGGIWEQYLMLMVPQKTGIVQGQCGKTEATVAVDILTMFCSNSWVEGMLLLLRAINGKMKYTLKSSQFPEVHPLKGKIQSVVVEFQEPQEDFWIRLYELLEKEQNRQD